MTRLRYMNAWSAAIRDEMLADDKTFLIGEDIRESLRRGTAGMWHEFGDDRVLDAPLSEAAFVGFATGAAIAGWRPIVEFEIPTIVYVACDQIINQAGKFSLMTGGQSSVPVTYLIPGSGAREGLAGQHSDHPYALLAHAGIKTAVPATPTDAYGLIRAAIQDPDPVAIFGPAAALGEREEVDSLPTEAIPLGCARIARSGSDVTVVAIGHLNKTALRVAEELAEEIDVEVFDPRSVFPFDWERLMESVAKTGRLVVIDDSNRTCGLAAEIVSTVVERQSLLAPPVRVTRADMPVPFAPVLEGAMMPTADQLIRGIRTVMKVA